MALQLRDHDGSGGMNSTKNLSLRETADTTKRVSAPPAGAPEDNRPNSDCTSRESALRWVRSRLRSSRIAALASVAFFVSVSVCPIVAKNASRREVPHPVHLTKTDKKWVAATLRSLSLEEKVGQMLMGRCFLDYTSFESPDYKKLKDELQKYHIGSFVVAVHVNRVRLERPSPMEAAKVANQLQTDSKLPLLIAAASSEDLRF